MQIETERAYNVEFDTLIVGSAPDTRKPPKAVLTYLQRAFTKTRRVASICVGAFILGEAGRRARGRSAFDLRHDGELAPSVRQYRGARGCMGFGRENRGADAGFGG